MHDCNSTLTCVKVYILIKSIINDALKDAFTGGTALQGSPGHPFFLPPPPTVVFFWSLVVMVWF